MEVLRIDKCTIKYTVVSPTIVYLNHIEVPSKLRGKGIGTCAMNRFLKDVV